MKAILGMLDIVPGWVWALVLSVSLAYGGVEHVRGAAARSAEKSALAQRDAFSTELETTRAKVDDNKRQAVKLLAAEIIKNLDAETRLKDLTEKMEADRAKSQTDLVAAIRVRSTERLSFNAPADTCRRWGGGGGAQSQASGPAQDPAAAVTITLPEPVNRSLWNAAGEADSLSIDYRVLYDWANNPKLVCELQP